jgi:hypothetical protein
MLRCPRSTSTSKRFDFFTEPDRTTACLRFKGLHTALSTSMGWRDSLRKAVPGDGIGIGFGLHQFRTPKGFPAADLVPDDDIFAKCFFRNCSWKRAAWS